jgi:hypothetical protein
LGNDKIEHSNEVNTTMEYPGVVPIMKDRIDKCLSDKLEALAPASTPWGIFVEQAGSRAKLIRDSDLFGNFITVAILVVGVMIGVDTDFTMRCERMYSRLDYEDPAESDETSQLMELRENCHHGETGSQIVTLVAQVCYISSWLISCSFFFVLFRSLSSRMRWNSRCCFFSSFLVFAVPLHFLLLRLCSLSRWS